MNDYWCHPSFKDVFMLITKRHYYRGMVVMKGFWMGCGWVGKSYWTHIPFKFKLTREKVREFQKFKDMDECYNIMRGV